MNIVVNGEPREVGEATTVTAFLEDLGFKPETTVVERNADILDRSAFGSTTLEEGDTLELVRFVGGG